MLICFIFTFLPLLVWGQTLRNITFDDTDPAIIYSEPWSQIPNVNSRSFKNGSIHYTFNGSTARLQFTGIAVYYFSPLWRFPASVALSIDNGPLTTVNLQDRTLPLNASIRTPSVDSQVVWSTELPSNSQHTLDILGVGEQLAVLDSLIITVLDQPLQSATASIPPASSSTSTTSSRTTPMNNRPMIIGIVVGVVLGLTGIAIGILYVRYRGRFLQRYGAALGMGNREQNLDVEGAPGQQTQSATSVPLTVTSKSSQQSPLPIYNTYSKPLPKSPPQSPRSSRTFLGNWKGGNKPVKSNGSSSDNTNATGSTTPFWKPQPQIKSAYVNPLKPIGGSTSTTVSAHSSFFPAPVDEADMMTRMSSELKRNKDGSASTTGSGRQNVRRIPVPIPDFSGLQVPEAVASTSKPPRPQISTAVPTIPHEKTPLSADALSYMSTPKTMRREKLSVIREGDSDSAKSSSRKGRGRENKRRSRSNVDSDSASVTTSSPAIRKRSLSRRRDRERQQMEVGMQKKQAQLQLQVFRRSEVPRGPRPKSNVTATPTFPNLSPANAHSSYTGTGTGSSNGSWLSAELTRLFPMVPVDRQPRPLGSTSTAGGQSSVTEYSQQSDLDVIPDSAAILGGFTNPFAPVSAPTQRPISRPLPTPATPLSPRTSRKLPVVPTAKPRRQRLLPHPIGATRSADIPPMPGLQSAPANLEIGAYESRMRPSAGLTAMDALQEDRESPLSNLQHLLDLPPAYLSQFAGTREDELSPAYSTRELQPQREDSTSRTLPQLPPLDLQRGSLLLEPVLPLSPRKLPTPRNAAFTPPKPTVPLQLVNVKTRTTSLAPLRSTPELDRSPAMPRTPLASSVPPPPLTPPPPPPIPRTKERSGLWETE